MRVLLLTDALPPRPRGGLDLHVRDLDEALRLRGCDVAICALSQQPLAGALQAHRPEIVHIHSLQGRAHRLVEAAVRSGARVVWTLHDFFSLCSRVHLHDGRGAPCSGPRGGRACGPCFGGVRRLLGGPLFGRRTEGFARALGLCEALIAPSGFLSAIFVDHGVDPSRIHTLPTAAPRPARDAARPNPGEPSRVLYLGDLRHAKGPDLLVEAFARLDPGRARLEVHGGAPAPPAPPEAAYGRSIREAGLPSLAVGGAYAPSQLPELLDGASVVVVPSRVRESFGRTANEALQAGVPVVVADHGALPEQVSEGLNGLLFAAGDAESLAGALDHVLDCGLTMQRRRAEWPVPPDLEGHVDGLLEIYAEGAA